MLWNNNPKIDLPTHAEMARNLHSAWLTWALNTESPFPRIPSQPVRDGGYESLLASPQGRRICDRWWRRALATIERLTPPGLR
ncbi:MAG: hypothetical protein IPJ41_01895 [Phycisphaerales bacterium]|nr:hypothetical protein [Phycisphaerales bacterium]